MTLLDGLATAIADKRGVEGSDRTDGMMAVFRMDSRAVVEALVDDANITIEGIRTPTIHLLRWQEMLAIAFGARE